MKDKYPHEAHLLINPIASAMKSHYELSFDKFGPHSSGVDWGNDIEKTNLRYKKMLAVSESIESNKASTMLDVGCGYGGLIQYMKNQNISMDYTGIDFASNMIDWAKINLKDEVFIEANFLDYDFAEKKYDYVVCNGILTQKLESSLLDMDRYAKSIIGKMYSLCNKAIAFNIMSTAVNFFAPNLYYKHPAEIICYCMSEISRNFKIDHSYGIYEYTVYLHK
jgi:SAM-dependent methyltransferase